MSIKKAISVSFLLLANMVMLAHSVAFHHHDSQMTDICDGNTDNHCHDSEYCCAFENCLLSNTFTKADDFKPIKPIFNTFDVIVFPAKQIIQIIDLVGLPFRQKPYIPLFYSEFISQSIGLRAPPAC